jgi:predicted nucleic acid-binding protein
MRAHEYSKPFQSLFLRVLDFSNEDAQQTGRLELNLERKGKKIKRTYIMIASIAINKGAYLYAFDNDFQALTDFGLKLID